MEGNKFVGTVLADNLKSHLVASVEDFTDWACLIIEGEAEIGEEEAHIHLGGVPADELAQVLGLKPVFEEEEGMTLGEMLYEVGLILKSPTSQADKIKDILATLEEV